MNQNSQPTGGAQDPRRTLLARLLVERAAAVAGESAPLSFSQQRLWFFDQLMPGTAAYNIPVGLTLAGPLNVAALERAIGEILRRHEVLRANITVREGVPFQRIAPWSAFQLELVDVCGAGGAARAEAAAREVAEQDARQPFDLHRGPLFRARLIRFRPDAHLLSVVFHHLVMDGWSTRVFVREVAAIYDALHAGRAPGLPPLPIQYADFARSQRETADDAAMQSHLAYWKDRLAGAPAVTELATDFPRQAQQTFRGAAETMVLPAEASADLKALSRRHGVTLFMTALAAWKVLVSRLTGQTDLVIGSPIAGRTRTDVEGLIGCFVNALPLRTDLSDRPAFDVMLHRVRDACLGAYAHQDLPFERLVEELHPRRDLARPPVFQLVCNMLVPDAAKMDVAGLEVGVILPEEESSKFDVTLYVLDGEQIVIRLAYNADLFEPRRMQELLAQFRVLLAQVAADPTRPIVEYSLLTETAVAALPDPRKPIDGEADGVAVDAAFVERVRQAPGRQAIVFGDRTLTYAELELRSRRIAERLRRTGFGAEKVAAVYAHRSPGLVAAMLGVLRAGGAFAILDPSHPAGRSIRALEAVRPSAWIAIDAAGAAPAELTEHLARLPQSARLGIDESGLVAGDGDEGDEASAAQAVAGETVERSPSQLAYVAFTSGSTGEPKVILGEHGPLSHFVAWHARTFGLTADDRYTMLSGLSHDPLLRDVFTPLCTGATLCIPACERADWAERLPEWLAATGATVMHLTPSLLRLLVSQTEECGHRTPLRYAFFGGEPLTGRDIAALQRLAPRARAINFYGTTETPQAMGFYCVDPAAVADASATVPVGRGIDGVQLLVVNDARELAAPGEPGEIYVRTRHLARGYAAPDADGRFTTNPFTGDADDRIYRTGDIGRYDVAGNVLVLGRGDFQVKIRGHRVEPAEIEAFLRAQPGVEDAIVVARQDDAGESRLVAYARGASADVQPDALRRAAREKLPEYMVPASVVVLSAFPLTANGKVDRAALPAPDAAQSHIRADVEAPRTPLERQIADIWSGLLGCGPVSVHDSFFDLGGHSLLATQLISRLRAALDVDLPVRALFESPTVAGMARRVDMLQWAAAVPAAALAHGTRELEL